MRKISLLFLSLLGFLASAQKVEYNAAMTEGLKALAEVRYTDLEAILKAERQANPENRVADYLEVASICIRGFFVEDEAWFAAREERLDQLVAKVEQLPKREPYKRVMLAEMALGIAGTHGKFKHNIKAAWGFYRAYNLLSDNLEAFPNFIPTLVPFGVLQTAVGSLPSDYKSMASLFGFNGDIEKGLAMIRKAYYYSLADPNLKPHQDYFGFVYAYVNFELKTEEQVSLNTLGMDVSSSSFYLYLEAQQELRSGDAAAALKLLQSRPEGSRFLKIPFFDYYTGKVALMVDPDEAQSRLLSFISESKDSENRKSAYRYLAWYHLLKQEPVKAEEYRKRILSDEEETLTGSDKQARDEAQRGFNIFLIRARLNFDAGRYAKVVEELKPADISKHCTKDWEKQEFYYRRARALQELGLDDQAIPTFLKAMDYSSVSSFSLANSTLQVAILFEERGNWSQARKYFEDALALEDYPFHEGIQQKAKAGIQRLP